MRIINEEYKPFILCSEEVKNQLKDAHTYADKIEYLIGETSLGQILWARNFGVFEPLVVYRAFVPEIKKVPWNREDYIKNNVAYLKHKTIKSYYTVLALCNDYMCVFNEAAYVKNTYDEVAMRYTLPDGTELYKEVTE